MSRVGNKQASQAESPQLAGLQFLGTLSLLAWLAWSKSFGLLACLTAWLTLYRFLGVIYKIKVISHPKVPPRPRLVVIMRCSGYHEAWRGVEDGFEERFEGGLEERFEGGFEGGSEQGSEWGSKGGSERGFERGFGNKDATAEVFRCQLFPI